MEIRSLVKNDFVLLEENDSIAEMIGKMKNFDKRTGMVFRNDKYLGMVERKGLLKLGMNPNLTKVKGYVHQTALINENSELQEAAGLLCQCDTDYLPVEKDKKVIGIISALDLASVLAQLPEAKNIKVKEVKLVRPTKIDKEEYVARAMNLMHDEKIDVLPIFDKEDLYGVITFRDLLRQYLNWTPKRDGSAKFNNLVKSKAASVDTVKLGEMPVSNFSTNDGLLTANLETSLPEAMNLMLKNKIRDLLVMDGNKFAGVLTVKNILQQIQNLSPKETEEVQLIGWNEIKLKPFQKKTLMRVIEEETEKLSRKLPQEAIWVIHAKSYRKGGIEKAKQKYTFHIRIEMPGKVLSVSEDDWDVEVALKGAFKNASNQIKSKFKTEGKKRDR